MTRVELKGRLSSLPLADLLKLINSRGHTGRLALQSEQRTSSLYIDQGKLIFLGCLMDPIRVGLRLACLGHLSRRDLLAWKRAVRQGENTTLLEVYPGPNISPEAWRQAFRIEMQDEGLEIFSWDDGDFEFETGSISLSPGLRLDLAIETYLDESTRQAERWKEIRAQLPKEDEVPVAFDFSVVEKLPSHPLSEIQWRVLAHVDGRRNLRALSSLAAQSYFDTCLAILELVQKEYVHWAPRPKAYRKPPKMNEQPDHNGKGFFHRLTSKEGPLRQPQARGVEVPSFSSPVSLLTEFENRLLASLQEETNGEFNVEPFLEDQWWQLGSLHPLIDWFPLPADRLCSARFESDVPGWQDDAACNEVVLDSLDALQDLADATFAAMQEHLGDKKALQIHRREHDRLFEKLGTGLSETQDGSSPIHQAAEQLSLLSLAR